MTPFIWIGAAHRLQSLLDRLNGEAQFSFIPGRTHFDLYQKGDDKYALFDRIAAESDGYGHLNSDMAFHCWTLNGDKSIRTVHPDFGK